MSSNCDDILDMLFDNKSGVLGDVKGDPLSDEMTNGQSHSQSDLFADSDFDINAKTATAHTINMEDLDYLSCDFLDDILQFPADCVSDGNGSPNSAASPGYSDSGVSMDGTDDLLATDHTDHSYTSSVHINQSHPTDSPIDQSNLIDTSGSQSNLGFTTDLGVQFDLVDSIADVFDESIFSSLDKEIFIDVDVPVIKSKRPVMRLKKVDLLPMTINDIDVTYTDDSHSYDKLAELRLSDEEKLLLAKEGFVIPTHLPLTKEEERQLKCVRRKIRNKISAKESRKRKMTYMDGLENRVKMSTVENAQLRKKVNALEQQNLTLMQQLKKLQTLISTKTSKSAQASTCVMVLALSFMFIMIPTYSPWSHLWSASNTENARNTLITPGNSRSLLQSGDPRQPVDHDLDPFGVTSWPLPPWSEPQHSTTLKYVVTEQQSLGKVGERGRLDGEPQHSTTLKYVVTEQQSLGKVGERGRLDGEPQHSTTLKYVVTEQQSLGKVGERGRLDGYNDSDLADFGSDGHSDDGLSDGDNARNDNSAIHNVGNDDNDGHNVGNDHSEIDSDGHSEIDSDGVSEIGNKVSAGHNDEQDIRQSDSFDENVVNMEKSDDHSIENNEDLKISNFENSQDHELNTDESL